MRSVPSGPKLRFRAPLLIVVVLISSTATLYGCGGGEVIDPVKLEDTIEASLEDSVREKIKKVECPSDVSVDPGKTFTCDVTFSDDRREVATLKIRNEDADITMVGLKPKN